jgi:hypothetical protein
VLIPPNSNAFEPQGICVSNEISLPPLEQMIDDLRGLAEKEEAIARSISALETGFFEHPDGRKDELGVVRLDIGQAALLAHLAKECTTTVSVEVGFGMGSSTCIIMGTRRLGSTPFSHVVFDPWGLQDGRGNIVQSYLQERFPKGFNRIMKKSEIGLAGLLDRLGPGTVGLLFIDGGHRFENVMTDFMLADQLCSMGGYVVLDDALFPAIETVVNFVQTNRPDYAVAHLAVPNCTVLKKIANDERDWDSFKPFEVPQREDWTPATVEPAAAA